MQLKTKYLVIFVAVGIAVMTILVLNMQVKKEVMEVIQNQYEQGNIPADTYKAALSDGKLSNWEALQLKKH